MILLKTCPVPHPEYACLSVLMDNSALDVEPFVELVTIASPLSTTSPLSARESLQELHRNINTQLGDIKGDDEVYQSSFGDCSMHAQHQQVLNSLPDKSNNDCTTKIINNDGLQSARASIAVSRFQACCIAEESDNQQKRNSSKIQGDTLSSYIPKNGMDIEYILVKGKNLAQKCISSFQKIDNVANFPIRGIIIAIGVTGASRSAKFGLQTQSLRKRMMEFAASLRSIKLCSDEEMQQRQKIDLETILLSLLMDDESLKTNLQFDAEFGNVVDSEAHAEIDAKASKPKLFPKKFSFKEKRKRRRRKDEGEEVNKMFASTALISSSAPSSEVARIISDQMQVLCLEEKDMNLVGYKNATGKTERVSTFAKSPTRASRRFGKDLVGFDFVPISGNSFNPIPMESHSIAGSASFVSDTTSVTASTISTDSSATGYIPTLSGPSRDSSYTKRQMRRNKVLAASVSYQQSASWSNALSVRRTSQSPQHESSQGGFDHFGKNANDIRNGPSNGYGNRSTENSPGIQSNEFENPIDVGISQSDFSSPSRYKAKSKGTKAVKTPPKSPYIPGSRKLFTTIALNEDLACTYRGSKLTSCAVQGIVQLQMRSQSTAFVPFVVRVFDKEEHIETIEENEQYANNLSNERRPEDEWTNKFIVTLPKADSYYPILKYTCSNKVIPVPLVSSEEASLSMKDEYSAHY